MDALSKEEYMKKLKQSLYRTYGITTSFYDGSEMRSRIVKCELTSLEKNWFGIHITKIFVEGKKYDVDFYFEFKPWGPSERCSIRKCDYYIRDGDYFYSHLRYFNTYDSWYSHFRECIHCLSKVLESYAKRGIWPSHSSKKGIWSSNT